MPAACMALLEHALYGARDQQVDLGDLPALLECGDEAAGRDHAQLRALPAHQRLRAHEPVRPGVDDGLVVGDELLGLDRGVDVVEQALVLEVGAEHIGVEDRVGRGKLVLDRAQCGGSVVAHRGHVECTVMDVVDAAAGADVEGLVALESHRVAQGVLDSSVGQRLAPNEAEKRVAFRACHYVWLEGRLL